MNGRLSAVAPGVVLFGWSAFAFGLLGQLAPRYRELAASPPLWLWQIVTLILGPAVIVALFLFGRRARGAWWPLLERQLHAHTRAIDAIPAARLGGWIALASGAGLFAELMMIRIHASCFELFANFKNVSLLSCFLGLGIGYARGDRNRSTALLLLPALALQIALLHSLRLFGVAEFLRNPVTDEGAIGLATLDGAARGLTVYGFLIAVFATNALCFVPLGEVASRLMARYERLPAYGWNLLGSIAGIAVFSALSFAWTPPSVWILALGAAVLTLLRSRGERLASAAAVAGLVALLGVSISPNALDFYSPYQILTLRRSASGPTSLSVNNAYYQRLLDLRPDAVDGSRLLQSWANYYAIPYRLKPAPENVLVVGAGTGNDVAAALRNGARHVDAVEIDPAILAIGRAAHPEAPYASPRVTAIVDDARSFVRRSRSRYDLVVYGLLDSHTLLAGMSNVRLDSYVYTVEALREARARLAPEGVLSLSFTLPSAEIGHKLYSMLEQAFDGTAPRVVLSYYDRSVTFLAGATGPADRALPEGLVDVTASMADPSLRIDVSTDDWPFLFMVRRTYPSTYAVVIAALFAVSLALIRGLLPDAASRLSLPCFFLGAGFMLLETKAITELALEFGTTWVVVSAVIASVLVLGFFANALVARIRRPRRGILYTLLIASLVSSWTMAGLELSRLPSGPARLLFTVILTLPLFFAGMAFSAEVEAEASAGISGALSANLLGAMLGGFLEYNSMVLGFSALWGFALGAYVLAAATSLRTR